jgi:hypothetical protein
MDVVSGGDSPIPVIADAIRSFKRAGWNLYWLSDINFEVKLLKAR